MQFIHFIAANLKKKVLKDGIPLHPNQRKINAESTGIFCYPLLKIPFKLPWNKEVFEEEEYLEFQQQEQELNASLSIEEAWALVGASRVKKRDDQVKQTQGIIIELEPTHWPLTVFMDIRHSIAPKLAQLLDKHPKEGIVYGLAGSTFLEMIQGIPSKKYVIANAPFTVHSESDLLDFIAIWQQAGGGLWREDSFECMLTQEVPSKNIVQILEETNS